MSADANRIVNKLWSYCNVLRDDGLSYGDYCQFAPRRDHRSFMIMGPGDGPTTLG